MDWDLPPCGTWGQGDGVMPRADSLPGVGPPQTLREWSQCDDMVDTRTTAVPTTTIVLDLAPGMARAMADGLPLGLFYNKYNHIYILMCIWSHLLGTPPRFG